MLDPEQQANDQWNQQTPIDNPLGDIDPMAWLESLAKRQGATEGMTTAADLDIPEVDPNSVVIDEPGYTPYELGGGSKKAAKPPAEVPAAPPPPPVEEPPVVAYDSQPQYDQQQYDQQQYDQQYYDQQPQYDRQQYDPNYYQQQPQYDQQQYDPNYYQQPPQAYDPQFYEQPTQPGYPVDPAPAAMGTDMGLPDGIDPMAWLESLAKRQGATEGMTTAADLDIPEVDPNSVVIDEPGYTPYDLSGKSKAKAAEAAAQAAVPPPAPEPVYEPPPAYEPEPVQYAEAAPAPMGTDTGLADGIDPMAWLESLAKRQGATEGMTTAADLDIPEVDPNTAVVDEPGYTPYDLSGKLKKAADAATQAAAAPPPPPEPVYEPPVASFEPLSQTEDFLASFADEPSGVPGFGADDSTSWLDSLVQESGAEVADFLSPQASEGLPGFDLGFAEAAAPVEEAIPPTHTPEQLTASIDNLTNDQIAHLQATRQLTPEQELAWLMRQASGLAAVHDEEEFIEVHEDLGPAEMGDIPPWLQQNVQIKEEAEPTYAFSDEIALPPEPADLPTWLQGEAAASGESVALELPDFTLERADFVPEIASPGMATAEELSEMLNLEDYDPAKDEWAQALDEEHERMTTGAAEEDPAWFLNAKQSVAEEEDLTASLATIEPEAEPIAAYESEEMVVASDLPDWLSGVVEAPAAQMEGLPDDLPDWLRPAAASAPTDIDSWLRQEESAAAAVVSTPPPAAPVAPVGQALPAAASERYAPAQTGPLPDWAAPPVPVAPRPAAPPPVRQPVPAAPVRAVAPPPAVRPAQTARPSAPPPVPTRDRSPIVTQPMPAPRLPAEVPASPAFAQFKAQLDQNPTDHPTRLNLARAIAQGGDVVGSLQQYESLVDQVAMLEDVAGDLLAMIERNPAHPRARRVLGDAYMRQGYLQEALDAYRGALDNL